MPQLPFDSFISIMQIFLSIFERAAFVMKNLPCGQENFAQSVDLAPS